jgi:hypothetical protein
MGRITLENALVGVGQTLQALMLEVPQNKELLVECYCCFDRLALLCDRVAEHDLLKAELDNMGKWTAAERLQLHQQVAQMRTDIHIGHSVVTSELVKIGVLSECGIG